MQDHWIPDEAIEVALSDIYRYNVNKTGRLQRGSYFSEKKNMIFHHHDVFEIFFPGSCKLIGTDGFAIHHEDNDPTNNVWWNLSMKSFAQHSIDHNKEYWESMSPEVYDLLRKDASLKQLTYLAQLTNERKAELCKADSEGQILRWKNVSEDDRKEWSEMMVRVRARESPERKTELGEIYSEAQIKQWENMPEDEYVRRCKIMQDSRTPEVRKCISEGNIRAKGGKGFRAREFIETHSEDFTRFDLNEVAGFAGTGTNVWLANQIKKGNIEVRGKRTNNTKTYRSLICNKNLQEDA